MGRKNTLNVYITTSGGIPLNSPTNPNVSISLAASFNTASTEIANLDNIAYQINITTVDSTGTFYLQCSSDNVNFIDIGTAAIAAGANDNAVVWVNQEFCSPYVRLRYAPSVAGTGSCTIILTAKDVGA
jgi:hypothetical protein